MATSFDIFTKAFLNKVNDYNFLQRSLSTNEEIIDGYMKTTLNRIKNLYSYDFLDRDDDKREFNFDFEEDEIYDILDIVSEGMVVQWLRPYVYDSDNLRNILNSKEYSMYSSANLISEIRKTFSYCDNNFKNLIREYSFTNGNLENFHN